METMKTMRLHSAGTGSIIVLDIRSDPRERARQPGRTPKVPSSSALEPAKRCGLGRTETKICPARSLESDASSGCLFSILGEDTDASDLERRNRRRRPAGQRP